MFNPKLTGNAAEGFGSIAHKAIEMCDEDLRTLLYNNIVLAGGTTLMKGFADRFESIVILWSGQPQIVKMVWFPVCGI